MIDIHSHLMPGVDDGAEDDGQVHAALEVMWGDGVRTLVATPHIHGSIAGNPRKLEARLADLEVGWARLRAVAADMFPDLRVERGTEVMLDTPTPRLVDERLRLAGTSFVLVEFPHMTVPPNGLDAIFGLKMNGWIPVIAHPERYAGVDPNLALVEEWRRVGGLLQVNCGSLLGRYGDRARVTSWRLLRRGWVDYISSDYHARGSYGIQQTRDRLMEAGGEELAHLLMDVNPGRLVAGEPPEAVPKLPARKRPLWQRLFR